MIPALAQSPQVARPFVKWAGGKAQLVDQYRPLLPRSFGRYLEPFVGGGALFFALGRPGAYLADANEELMNTYRVVRDDPEGLLEVLHRHAASHSPAHYYEVRKSAPADDLERAARFIYLNRTCFNGLYRVNRRGQFNVPVGDYKNPTIADADNLRVCSRALQGCALESADFRAVLDVARPADLVYLDPPYDVTSKTARFTAFTASPFGWAEQEALRSVFERFANRGVYCMLSNADTPRVRELYRGFPIRTVSASRRINSAGARRGLVDEVVVLSYELQEAPCAATSSTST